MDNRDDLAALLEQRRADPAFAERVRRRMAEDKAILDRLAESERSDDVAHHLALELARHQRVDPPHAHCTCDRGGEEVVRLGELFSKHLVDVVLAAGWMPADQAGVLFERVRAERDALAATVQQVGEWMMVNEIDEPPLDWAGLGEILRAAPSYPAADPAGWVPGELLAAEQARNATLTDTIQRVEALAEQWERWAADATKRGYPSPEEGLTFAQETHARNLRRALFGPGEEDG